MKVYILLAVLIFSGCATTLHPIQPSLEIIDIPHLNEVQQSELGDTIVSKGKQWTCSGMSLLEEVRAEGKNGLILGITVTIPPGDLRAQSEDDKWVYYEAKKLTAVNSLGATFFSTGGLKRSKKDGSFEVYAPYLTSVGYRFKKEVKPTPKHQIKRIKISVEETTFQQELIYNGKVGSNVKFMYREISNDLMRPAFSQEVQYDLNESKTLGFKGVRIEVVEATNTHLKYKVLSSFPDLA
jgi:hypothetical protein